MKVIGLTGGIGSGKSTVSAFLAKLGAVVIDADKIGHRALEEDKDIRYAIEAAFGKRVLGADGRIDRARLSEVVFGDQNSLSRLNQIMHQRMFAMVEAELSCYRGKGVGVVVLEAPILIEAGWASLADEIWVTIASQATSIERLEKSRGFSREQSLARMRSQLPSEERLKHADVVIDTDCPLKELETKVAVLWARFT